MDRAERATLARHSWCHEAVQCLIPLLCLASRIEPFPPRSNKGRLKNSSDASAQYSEMASGGNGIRRCQARSSIEVPLRHKAQKRSIGKAKPLQNMLW